MKYGIVVLEMEKRGAQDTRHNDLAFGNRFLQREIEEHCLTQYYMIGTNRTVIGYIIGEEPIP